jgi:predicted DNA-binding ribbon-helix-helix protein
MDILQNNNGGLTVPYFTDEDILEPFHKVITDLIFLAYSGDIEKIKDNIISDFNIEECESEDYYEEAIKIIAMMFLKALELNEFSSIEEINKKRAISALNLIRFSKDFNDSNETFNTAIIINCFRYLTTMLNKCINVKEKARLADCVSNQNLTLSLFMLGDSYINKDITNTIWNNIW